MYFGCGGIQLTSAYCVARGCIFVVGVMSCSYSGLLLLATGEIRCFAHVLAERPVTLRVQYVDFAEAVGGPMHCVILYVRFRSPKTLLHMVKLVPGTAWNVVDTGSCSRYSEEEIVAQLFFPAGSTSLYGPWELTG